MVVDAPGGDLAGVFRAAAPNPACNGFAVGWSLFEGVARRWFAGEVDYGEAAGIVADNFGRAIGMWREAAPTA